MTHRFRGLVLASALLCAPASGGPPVLVSAAVQPVQIVPPATGEAPTAPQAFLVGPLQSVVGREFTLDPRGSVGTSLSIRVSRGPEALKVLPLYTSDRQLARGVVTPSKPGNYEFVIIASGDPIPPSTDPQWEFGFWTVTVISDQPLPPLPPIPTPIPPSPGPVPPQPTPVPPQPTPTPVPVPSTVKLYAVMVYGTDPLNPDDLASVAMRDDPSLGPALTALNVSWHPMDLAAPRLDTLKLRPFLTAGQLPQLLVYDGGSPASAYDATGKKIGQIPNASFKSPTTSLDMVNLFKRFRGIN